MHEPGSRLEAPRGEASRLEAPPSVLIAAGAATGATCDLDPEDIAHLRVLRVGAGMRVRVVDGAGRCFEGEVATLGRHAGQVTLVAEATPALVAPPAVWLLQGVLHGARMDWLVEKATELGVAGIVAVQTSRAQGGKGGKGEGRAARWERVMRAAFLQSLGLWRPRLEFAQDMHEAQQLADVRCLVLADPDGQPWDEITLPAASIGVVVGPEGGLTPDERATFINSAALRANLGPTRLRAETAALVLTAAVTWRRARRG